MNYSAFDIFSLVVLIVLGLRGLRRGFVRELLGKAAYIVGLLVALMFSGLAAEYISEIMGIGGWSNVIAFVLLYFAGFWVTRLFSISFEQTLKQLKLKPIDTFFGLALGLLEGAIVVSFIVFLLRLQHVADVSALLSDSRIASLLEPIAPYSIDLVKGSI